MKSSCKMVSFMAVFVAAFLSLVHCVPQPFSLVTHTHLIQKERKECDNLCRSTAWSRGKIARSILLQLRGGESSDNNEIHEAENEEGEEEGDEDGDEEDDDGEEEVDQRSGSTVPLSNAKEEEVPSTKSTTKATAVPKPTTCTTVNKYKLQVQLPNGRSRPLTLSAETNIAELQRVLLRMMSSAKSSPTASGTAAASYYLKIGKASTTISFAELTARREELIASIFKAHIDDNHSNNELVVIVSTTETISNANENTDTNNSPKRTRYRKGSTSATKKSEEDNGENSAELLEKLHIKRQKPAKHRRVVISPQLQPVLQELYSKGGVALLGGQIIRQKIRENEENNDASNRSNNRRRVREKKAKKILTMQDLKELEKQQEDSEEEILMISTALHLTRNTPYTLNHKNNEENKSYVTLLQEHIFHNLAQAQTLFQTSGIQTLGIVMSDSHHTAEKENNDDDNNNNDDNKNNKNVHNLVWSPETCVSLMTATDLLQNHNRSILISIVDEAAPITDNNHKRQQRRRSLTLSDTKESSSNNNKNNNKPNSFVLEAFSLSKQAWQLYQNQSVIAPTSFLALHSSNNKKHNNKRRKEQQLRMEQEDNKRAFLSVRYGVRVGQDFDKEEIDAWYFAVPIAISLLQSNTMTTTTTNSKLGMPTITQNLVHIFPTLTSILEDSNTAGAHDKINNVQHAAETFTMKCIRKIVNLCCSSTSSLSGRREIDEDTWQRLYDVHWWQYLLHKQYLSPAAFQQFVTDLQDYAHSSQQSGQQSGQQKTSVGRKKGRCLSSRVLMEWQMLVQLWDTQQSSGDLEEDDDVEEL